jgi:hypothetical protein
LPTLNQRWRVTPFCSSGQRQVGGFIIKKIHNFELCRRKRFSFHTKPLNAQISLKYAKLTDSGCQTAAMKEHDVLQTRESDPPSSSQTLAADLSSSSDTDMHVIPVPGYHFVKGKGKAPSLKHCAEEESVLG